MIEDDFPMAIIELTTTLIDNKKNVVKLIWGLEILDWGSTEVVISLQYLFKFYGTERIILLWCVTWQFIQNLFKLTQILIIKNKVHNRYEFAERFKLLWIDLIYLIFCWFNFS